MGKLWLFFFFNQLIDLAHNSVLVVHIHREAIPALGAEPEPALALSFLMLDQIAHSDNLRTFRALIHVSHYVVVLLVYHEPIVCHTELTGR